LRAEQELRVVIRLEEGRVKGFLVESRDLVYWGRMKWWKVACDRILEVSIAKEMLLLGDRKSLSLGVALWEGGLPVDLLPEEGMMEIQLGEEHFGGAWDSSISTRAGEFLPNYAAHVVSSGSFAFRTYCRRHH